MTVWDFCKIAMKQGESSWGRRIFNNVLILSITFLTTTTKTTTLVHGLKFVTTRVTDGDDTYNHGKQQKHLQWLRSSIFDPRTVTSKNDPAAEGVCTGYSGILKIDCSFGDGGGGGIGSVFFSNVINQLQYAERNNLIPWVHFSSSQYNDNIHDGAIHDGTPLSIDADGDEGEFFYFNARVGTTVTKEMAAGDTTTACGEGAYYPGPPDVEWSTLRDMTIVLDTGGVWDYYFKPVVKFHPSTMTPNDLGSCAVQPFVELPNDGNSNGGGGGGMFCCAPWALHPRPFDYLPEAARPTITTNTTNDDLHEWFRQTRLAASRIVNQYYHPQQWLNAQVDAINPIEDMHPCLALHIRTNNDDDSDGDVGRRTIPIDEFLPYAEIYAANRGSVIYVASDAVDDDVWDHIRREWPEHISRLVRMQKRRNNGGSGGDNSSNHLKITRALIDIYAMSRCTLFVHGYSIMSEAAIYVNFDLHHWSVNLDYPLQHIPLVTFEMMVQERVPPVDW